MTDTVKTVPSATTDEAIASQNPSTTEDNVGKEVQSDKPTAKTSAKSTAKTTRKSASARASSGASKAAKKDLVKEDAKDSSSSTSTETNADSDKNVKSIPEEISSLDAQVPIRVQKSSATDNAKDETPSATSNVKNNAKVDAKPNASLKQGAKQNVNAKAQSNVQTKNAQKMSKTLNNAQAQNKTQSGTRNSNVNAKNNRSRNVPKMSNARFVDKVFQNSSEALSRALVRKEQKQLLDQVLDADVPINHKQDAQTPTQVMKMPKVPPSTRPGRAAMFGNVPLSPLQYEPRHKSEDFSKAYLREKVYLDTDQAQRLFENCYDDINVSFSILATVLRRYDKDAFNRTEKTIIAELTRIQEHFRKGLTDVASSLDECVKEENRRVAFHDHEREYVVPIHTPYSLRYITCVTLYDKYVSRLNAALITGIVDYDSFDSCLRAANTILQQFRHDAIIIRHRTLRDLRNHSGRRTEIKRAEQMAEKSAQEERMETTDPHPSKRTKSEVRR